MTQPQTLEVADQDGVRRITSRLLSSPTVTVSATTPSTNPASDSG